MRKRRPSAIRQEIEAPALVGSLRDRQRRPGAKCPFAPNTPANLQPLLAIETTKLLVVHDQSLAAHQHKQTTVAEPAADRRQFAQAAAHGRLVSSLTAIAHRCAVCPQGLARPPVAHLERGPQMSDGLSPRGGRHHFFEATSLSIALSSMASANNFFSLAFSSSSAFSRLASDTSRRQSPHRPLLSQDPDDLFFREPTWLHGPSLPR
jgi:hypothetical protein